MSERKDVIQARLDSDQVGQMYSAEIRGRFVNAESVIWRGETGDRRAKRLARLAEIIRFLRFTTLKRGLSSAAGRSLIINARAGTFERGTS